MAQRKYYYKREDAEHLRQIFESWIDKGAQVGNGELSVLKHISIKAKRSIFPKDATHSKFSVEFRFSNSKIIDSRFFLSANGLSNLIPTFFWQQEG
jgi:hypothetical protein